MSLLGHGSVQMKGSDSPSGAAPALPPSRGHIVTPRTQRSMSLEVMVSNVSCTRRPWHDRVSGEENGAPGRAQQEHLRRLQRGHGMTEPGEQSDRHHRKACGCLLMLSLVTA